MANILAEVASKLSDVPAWFRNTPAGKEAAAAEKARVESERDRLDAELAADPAPDKSAVCFPPRHDAGPPAEARGRGLEVLSQIVDVPSRRISNGERPMTRLSATHLRPIPEEPCAALAPTGGSMRTFN